MAEEKKHRPLSTSEEEIRLLKEAFASSDGKFHVLKAVRSLFLGFPITTDEEKLVKSAFRKPETKLALRKKMYPMLSNESEIGEEADWWFGTENEVLDKAPETIRQVVESKQKVLEMLDTAFSLLDKPSGKKIDLSYDPMSKDDPLQIRLLARNKYVKTVVTGITIVKVIAGQTSESVEDARKRLLTDSTK